MCPDPRGLHRSARHDCTHGLRACHTPAGLPAGLQQGASRCRAVQRHDTSMSCIPGRGRSTETGRQGRAEWGLLQPQRRAQAVVWTLVGVLSLLIVASRKHYSVDVLIAW